jgi:hypothetical protein
MPLTNPRTKSTMRSIQQFVEDQTNYLDSTRAKVSSIFKEQQSKLLKELKSKPTIIFKSKSLAKKRPNYALPAHQRLYSFKKNNSINKGNKHFLNNSKKSLTANAQPAVFSVYKDALKRQIQERKESSPTALKKIINPESEKQIAKKLHRQIESACTQNNINANRMSYGQLKTILSHTGFTNISKKSITMDNEEEEALIQDMWDYITSNNKEANIPSVEAFLSGIINVKPLEKAPLALPKNIQNKYQKFNVNRVSSMLTKRRSSEQSNFNPVINATSYRLAKNRKVKQLQVNSHDKSCSKKEIEEISITAKREQEECTFSPQLNSFSRRLSSFSYQKDRCLDLYNQAKSDLKKRVDRSTEEVEFEKSKNELTFMPSLFHHKQRQSPSISTNTSLIKSTNDAKKNKEADEEKGTHASNQNDGKSSAIVQRKKKEKALTNRKDLEFKESCDMNDMNVKSSLFVAMDENTQAKTPILIIDVNIGADKVDKIVVNEGERIEIVCKKFVAKHGIILHRIRQ